MTTATVHALRAVALEEAPAKTGDGRTVLVRLVKYGVNAEVTDDGGRSYYTERFAPGSVRAEIGSLVYREIPRSGDPHFDRPKLVGKISGFRSTGDGAYAEVRISTSTDGNDLLADLDEEMIRHVSMEFDAPTLPKAGTRAAGPIVHTEAVVYGLLFTNVPQSPGADVLGRRSTPGETTMAETPVAGPFKGTIDGNIDGAITTPDPVEPVDPNAAPPDPNAGRAAPQLVSGAQRAVPSLSPAGAGRQFAPMATLRYRSFGEFAHAAALGQATDEERAIVHAALHVAAQTRGYRALGIADTGDVTGLLQTSWINEILELVRAYTPTINSFASRPLPDDGLTIAHPVVTTRPTVVKQTADGAAISSTPAVIAPVNMTVNTYGGGQGLTIATIRRTTPSYLEQVMRLYAIEMARAAELDVAAGVWATSDDTNAVVDLNVAADTDINTAFVSACLPFLNNLGRLPEFALINVPLWQRMANAKDTTNRPLFPGVSPVNPIGTLSLTDPNGDVRGLTFHVAPGLGDGGTGEQRAVVAVPEAYETMFGNISTMEADDPETLTHELAVFEFGAHGKIDAAGMVRVIPVP